MSLSECMVVNKRGIFMCALYSFWVVFVIIWSTTFRVLCALLELDPPDKWFVIEKS